MFLRGEDVLIPGVICDIGTVCTVGWLFLPVQGLVRVQGRDGKEDRGPDRRVTGLVFLRAGARQSRHVDEGGDICCSAEGRCGTAVGA